MLDLEDSDFLPWFGPLFLFNPSNMIYLATSKRKRGRFIQSDDG